MDGVDKKDILIKETGKQKPTLLLYKTGRISSVPSGNDTTNLSEGLHLLEFVLYNSVVWPTLGEHVQGSRCWTRHAPGGTYGNPTDCSLLQNGFQLGNQQRSKH
ncbi:hypothetical protein ACOMHN_042122 [Nucella lapillus]